jgi:hypothetical protein
MKKPNKDDAMQKFQKGDLVQIDKDRGGYIGRLAAGCEVVVVGSYADQFGGDDRSCYTLYLKRFGPCSWVYEQELTLIEPARTDKLQEWENEVELENKKKSDLDWIFANGESVIKTPDGASIQALANCFGLTNLWGNSGEGWTYYRNARMTLMMAEPYLAANNKVGWLEFCELLRVGSA